MGNFNFYTLDGKAVLEEYGFNKQISAKVCVAVDEDTIKNTDSYNCSAFVYQVISVLKSRGVTVSDSNDLLKKVVFLDFYDAIPFNADEKALFDEFFENGLTLSFNDIMYNGESTVSQTEDIEFVPFINSSSQAKKCVIAFICKDLFKELRKRLDLGLEFEKNADCISRIALSKLYAYRGLYSSDAMRVLDGADPAFEEFFNQNNIVVIDEIKIKAKSDFHKKVKVYTSQQVGISSENEPIINGVKDERSISRVCFDGEGLISPAACALINSKLNKKCANSFQVRMPFFKGMLHCVNFHAFLKDMGITEKAIVKDVFGKERDLFKANIIIPASMLKLCSLKYRSFLPLDVSDPMQYYFEKIREYNHGFYVVQTNLNRRNNGYTTLNYQYLNTLDISAQNFDKIIKEHTDNADIYSGESVLSVEFADTCAEFEDGQDSLMRLLRIEPRFIYDNNIEKQVKNYRVSKYNDILSGNIKVEGENRFLSGDLLYFLYRLAVASLMYSDRFITAEERKLRKEFYSKLLAVKRACNKYGAIYLPGCNPQKAGDRVGLLRSPHLSRNEDVGTVIFKENKYYEKYLSHLTGVVMVGYSSYIPAALGGADFDGDQINIVYNSIIADACFSGYVEGKITGLPFIDINSLEAPFSTQPQKQYNYINSEVVYRTFNSRIGLISNAALGIAAVEYKSNDVPQKVSAALCTILTGNEIDAAKKGVRPCLTGILNFEGETREQRDIVKEIGNYIKVQKIVDSWGGRIPLVTRDESGELTLADDEFSHIEIAENRDLTVTSQLLYRWATAFENFDKKELNTTSKERREKRQEIWSNFATCPAGVKDVLLAFKKVLGEYKKICSFKRSLRNNGINLAKIKTILKLQYDDIYSDKNGMPINARLFEFSRALIDLSCNDKAFDSRKLTDIKEKLYSEKENVFDVNEYWPFTEECDKNKLDALFDYRLSSTDIVKNFDAQGYKILYLVLTNVIKSVTLEEKKRQEHKSESLLEDNPYITEFRATKLWCMKNNVSQNKFISMLANKAKQKIEALFETDNKSEIIKSVYNCVDSSTREIFWDIYTIADILPIFEGDTND